MKADPLASRSAPYRILALDLDGTLLAPGDAIDARDLDAIERLQADGVVVTICTGRLYSGSRSTALRARMNGPVACVDGSHIVDVRDDRSLLHRGLIGADAEALRLVLERHGAASFLFAEDAIVFDDAGSPYMHYVASWSPNITQVARVTEHPFWVCERGVLAAVALAPARDIAAAVAELDAVLGDRALTLSFPVKRFPDQHALVVRAAGTTKGTAVSWLAEHHGCTAADVVVVGDWLNDIPMFQAAGRSFVMGHAPEAVKVHATDRLEGTLGGGVAEAIARAWPR